jgi:heat shock protein HslJ
MSRKRPTPGASRMRSSALALATALLAACAAAPDAAPALTGTQWQLDSASAGPLVELASASGVTLGFGAEHIEGFGGCNNYRASYVLEQGKLVAGPVGATKRGCAGDADRIEGTWFSILAAPLELVQADAGLELKTAGGTSLRFVAVRSGTDES